MTIPMSSEQQFIEANRRLKRLKKLPVTQEVILDPRKKGRGGNAYRYTRSGLRTDLGITLRSSWEADFARILTIHGIKFEFEPRKFTFPIKRGTKSYIPDFKIGNTWVEVKGYLSPKDLLKIKRFKRYYPDEFAQLIMLMSKSNKTGILSLQEIGVKQILFIEEFSKLYKEKIPNWESKK